MSTRGMPCGRPHCRHHVPSPAVLEWVLKRVLEKIRIVTRSRGEQRKQQLYWSLETIGQWKHRANRASEHRTMVGEIVGLHVDARGAIIADIARVLVHIGSLLGKGSRTRSSRRSSVVGPDVGPVELSGCSAPVGVCVQAVRANLLGFFLAARAVP